MERQYLLTERAHLMCPNMHFAIKAKINAGYDNEKMQSAIELLEHAHPFLKSVIAEEASSGKLYYEYQEDRHLEIISKGNALKWEEDYKEITANGWDAFQENLLKIIVYPSHENFDVMFIAHHLLGDGRAILGLIEEFAGCYVQEEKPLYVQEQLMGSIDDLPPGSSLAFINKLIINNANKKWLKENARVSRDEYREFEHKFIRENPIHYMEETVDAVALKELIGKCRDAGVSLNDYLVAEMMQNEHINESPNPPAMLGRME